MSRKASYGTLGKKGVSHGNGRTRERYCDNPPGKFCFKNKAFLAMEEYLVVIFC